ncbi:unnamed protein product [Dovyalis caffra]|uniref:Transmembrane protein n=1 Tax=Dovyalis caffra TaxID=77055 RepID=A0AAV1QRZ0_9ROSI|nr:unnamed protein product [Dovyalis caffra]
MDRLRRCTILVLFLFLLISEIAHGQQAPVDLENAQRSNIFSKIIGSLFSSSANPPATTNAGTGTSFWDKVRTVFNQAQASIFPPNLDFRGRDEALGHGDATGTGEKMKEAVAKSVEKGKATVEDSARSAAKIASETLQKTKEKVKKSLSGHERETKPQDEL